MGGPGSGRRWHIGARATTADALQLDIRRLRRQGFLEVGVRGIYEWRTRSGVSQIRFRVEGDDRTESMILSYAIGDQSHQQVVSISWTACNFGGARPWGHCPLCGRRLAVLYGRRTFACRWCHDLAYRSTREDGIDRSIREAQRLRERLGGSENLGAPMPRKPRGMHWTTYARLCEEARETEVWAYASIASRIGGLGRQYVARKHEHG